MRAVIAFYKVIFAWEIWQFLSEEGSSSLAFFKELENFMDSSFLRTSWRALFIFSCCRKLFVRFQDSMMQESFSKHNFG